MNKIKAVFKKWIPFYGFSQNIYHGFRKIIETRILGTRLQEQIWRRRKMDLTEGSEDQTLSPHRRLFIDRIVAHAPFDSVLEIGCAGGLNLKLIARKFPGVNLVGIDINERAVRRGNELFQKEGISNVKLLIGKADELDRFPDESFDVVFGRAALMYIGPDKIKKVASEMQRVSRKAVILLEYHSEEVGALGEYNRGNWLRNYRVLFCPFARSVEITKIPPELWEGDWRKFGHIIEIIKFKK